MLRKIKSYLLLNSEEKTLYVEAYFFLAWARLLKCIPFRKLSCCLGEQMDETTEDLEESNKKHLIQISQSIHIMSRYTLWESMCLVQAIAAMKMLERRNIESTIYFGTSKDKDGRLIAHAWLRSGPYFITGFKGMEKFTVVNKFARKLNA
ncbi:lasso peptide biosynthesis B2 protein [Paenibacillus cremeus]|uniref:Lasso peptide biosynthesis B2 protein n=1 Tax=Paenibacillus cremeus TaxID=2163881 RepID=A0A559K0H1_9BACL|nr:lasso peptide biosynthesis B2 protein [Paenibacillus cremeus]TVY05628.1 lasso peptide biosynthesis B2 protein [Paenibacillus cremeus]